MFQRSFSQFCTIDSTIFYSYRLVADGIDVNKRHPLGWTPLHVAAVNGRSEVVTALLELGADPNLGDNFVNVYHTAMEKEMRAVDGKGNMIETLRHIEGHYSKTYFF